MIDPHDPLVIQMRQDALDGMTIERLMEKYHYTRGAVERRVRGYLQGNKPGNRRSEQGPPTKRRKRDLLKALKLDYVERRLLE